jgi:methionine-rich copper-binding protein CopC
MRRVNVKLRSCCAAAVITICAMATLAPRVALAHAVLVSAQPEENSTVTGPDVPVLLKYNSRIDMERSTLTLLAPGGKLAKVTIGSQPAPGLLSATLTGLVEGAYELRWQVLAIDEHVTRGKVLFQIK